MANTDIDPAWLSQKQSCAILGIDPKTFRKIGFQPVMQHKNTKYYSPPELVKAYCVYCARQVGAGSGQDAIDLQYETARRTRAEADYREQKNAIMNGSYAAVDTLEFALSSVIGQAAAIMSSVPLNLKRRNPDLSITVVNEVEREMTRALNAIADVKVDWSAHDSAA